MISDHDHGAFGKGPRNFTGDLVSLDTKEQGGRKEQGGAEPTGKGTGRKGGKGTGSFFSLQTR